MTLESSDFAIAASGFAVGAAFYALSLFWKARSHQIERRQACRGHFFKIAKVMVEDEQTPLTVIDFIEGTSHHLRSRVVLWRVIYGLLSGEIKRHVANPSNTMKVLREDLDALPEHLKKAWAELIAALSFSVSYNNAFLGWLVRRLVFFSLSSKLGNDHTSAEVVVDVMAGSHASRPA